MNLISEPWIPVRRADGSRDKIAPCQITDHVGMDKSPIVAIASPRPDFDGALVQFLIGLLQTTCTPPNKGTWRQWRKEPPSAEELKSKLESVAFAFELEGEWAFMQEKLIGSRQAKEHPVTYLLIGAPTDSTLKNNTDHFQKRPVESECFCPSCAATALYTLQAFAPGGGGGGDGKFTGLRGGGPMTTLMVGESFWEMLWLNVVFGEPFANHEPNAKTFPWLDVPSYITEKQPVKVIHSIDMNAEHVFWGMPRRIYLEFTDNSAKAACAICTQITDIVCARYWDRSGGLTYQYEIEEFQNGKKKKVKKPSWIFPNHPLSPYLENEDMADPRPSAIHPQPGGIGYRHWLGLIENSTEGNTARKPAKVIEQFRSLAREDGRLWAFGYDMDNMKARCWYDATMPILMVPEGLEDIFKALVEQMVRAADWVGGILRGRVKDALLGSGDARGDLSFLQTHFWNATEGAFYAHVKNLRNVLSVANGEQPVLESWLGALRAVALTIFDHYAQSGDFDAVDPRRVATARNDLNKALNGRKLRGVLGLPSPARKAA